MVILNLIVAEKSPMPGHWATVHVIELNKDTNKEHYNLIYSNDLVPNSCFMVKLMALHTL